VGSFWSHYETEWSPRPGVEIAAVEILHKANRASAGVPRKLGYRFVGEAPDGKHAPADVGIYSSHKPATSSRPG
jgi:hypothetical protein